MTPTVTSDAITMIKNGKVGVFPTDTLYGLVARAADPDAVTRMYALKNRERKPGTLIAANVKQLIDLGLHADIVNAVSYLWPNPLSIVLPVKGLDYLHQGVQKLAVRVVADTELQEVLMQTGPLMTSSANAPGEPSANTVAMAHDYFKDLVDFYVDNGDLSDRKPSTIIGIKNGELVIFREGAITKAQLDLLFVQNR